MPYVLFNNQKYISTTKSNRRYLVEKIDNATEFDTETKAWNAIMSLPKEFQNIGFHPVCTPDDWRGNAFELTSTTTVRSKDNFVYKPTITYEDAVITLRDRVDKVQEFMIGIKLNYKKYAEELHTIEREIVDIEHKIEFCNVSAFDGYKLCKLLQEKRRKRRECKDMLMIYDTLLTSSVEDWLNGKPGNAMKTLDSRAYQPRELVDLFQ